MFGVAGVFMCLQIVLNVNTTDVFVISFSVYLCIQVSY